MKKPLLLFAITTLFSLSSFAQLSFGGSLGCAYNHPFSSYNKYSFSYLKVNGHNDMASYFRFFDHWGPLIELSINYQFNDRLSIVSGLSYQQKGYSLRVGQTTSSRFNDYYLSLPAFTEFSLKKIGNHEFFIEGGLFASYWVCSMLHYRAILFTLDVDSGTVSNKDFINKHGRRFELGLIGGMGYKLHFYTKWSFSVIAYYQYALTKQFKETYKQDYFNRNNTLVLQVGLLYNISK